MDNANFHSILQTIFGDDSNEDYRKKAMEFILTKASFPDLEDVPNKLCELNKIFKNEQEVKHFEYEHIRKVWNLFKYKYTHVLKTKPYLCLLKTVAFYNGFSFVKQTGNNKQGSCNLSFHIGYTQKEVFTALQTVNIEFGFANKIISEMIGHDNLYFHLPLDADKYDDGEWYTSSYSVFHSSSRPRVDYQRKAVKTNDDGSMYEYGSTVAADKICKDMPLLRAYNLNSKQLYEIVNIIIDEFCGAANNNETKYFLKSAVNYTNFFGGDVDCFVNFK